VFLEVAKANLGLPRLELVQANSEGAPENPSLHRGGHGFSSTAREIDLVLPNPGLKPVRDIGVWDGSVCLQKARGIQLGITPYVKPLWK
jgi:hypothetical protein